MITRGSDRIADAVRLLAAFGAVAVKPDLMTALKSGTSVYDTLKSLAREPPASVAQLADELTGEARRLFDATRDLPADADVLYGQMVEAGLVTPAEIVAAGMDAAAVTEAMLGKQNDPEHRVGPMQGLFRKLTEPTLARLLADKAFAADLTPAFMQGVLGRLEASAAILVELREKVGSLSGALDDLRRLSRAEMEALAGRFEIERVYALTDANLREALEKRAEDYRDYRARIEAIDERTAGLGNLKAAAKDAAERLDFDEVERLLAQVHAAELDIAAETAVLRADNALLRGRAEDAFVILSATADSFGAIGADETAWRRLNYCRRLRDHGLRYGGTGLALSESMVRRALQDVPDAPSVWADGLLLLGVVLEEQSRTVSGVNRIGLLHRARDANEKALAIFGDGQWRDQATVLGNVLAKQGEVFGGERGLVQLHAAVAAHRNALRVCTDKEHPQDWARTQGNLGNALAAYGERRGGDAGARLLWESVDAYCAALRIFTGGARWAVAMVNLGRAYELLADTGACASREDPLPEALACFEAALAYFEAEYMPEGYRLASEGVARVRGRLGPDSS